MPDNYIKNYTSHEEFLARNALGDFYTGFVINTGYAYVQHIPPLYTSGNNQFHVPIKVQAIDMSPESHVRSWNLSNDEFKERILKRNFDGTYSVTLPEGEFNINNPDDVKVNIYDGTENLMVDLNVKVSKQTFEGSVEMNYSTTIKMIDAPLLLQQKQESENAIPPLTPGDYIYGASNAFAVMEVPTQYLREVWGLDHTKYSSKGKAERYSIQLYESLKNNGYKIQARNLETNLIPKTLNTVNTVLKGAGYIFFVADVAYSRTLKASHLLFFVTAALPTSWVIGGVLIGTEILLKVMTDKGIGEWADHIAGKLGITDEDGSLISRRMISNPRDPFEPFICEPDNTRVVRNNYFESYEID